MLGLILQCVRHWVVATFGEAAWEQVLRKSGAVLLVSVFLFSLFAGICAQVVSTVKLFHDFGLMFDLAHPKNVNILTWRAKLVTRFSFSSISFQ